LATTDTKARCTAAAAIPALGATVVVARDGAVLVAGVVVELPRVVEVVAAARGAPESQLVASRAAAVAITMDGQRGLESRACSRATGTRF
jgi:hypothetical protein